MRRAALFFIPTLLLFFFGCGSRPVPDWKLGGFNALESYKTNFLQGEDRKADLYFDIAIEEFKKSGDLDLLDRALLTRCALRTAAMEIISGEECLLPDWPHSGENSAYLSFLRGTLDDLDESLLPPSYRGILKALREKRTEKVNEALGAIEDPLSRIVAAAVALGRGEYDESTLRRAFQTASREGWKKIVHLYLEKLEEYYRGRGESEKEHQVKRQREILNSPLQ